MSDKEPVISMIEMITKFSARATPQKEDLPDVMYDMIKKIEPYIDARWDEISKSKEDLVITTTITWNGWDKR